MLGKHNLWRIPLKTTKIQYIFLVAPYSVSSLILSFCLFCSLWLFCVSCWLIHPNGYYPANFAISLCLNWIISFLARVFMDFLGNLSSLHDHKMAFLYLSLITFIDSITGFHRWLILQKRLLILIIFSLETRKNADKVLLKNYDVFIHTPRLMKSHQVLMEQQTTYDCESKLIIIFDSADPRRRDKFTTNLLCYLSVWWAGEVKKHLASACFTFIKCEPSTVHIHCICACCCCCSSERRQKIIIYYGPLST